MLKAMDYYIYKNINNNNMGILQESLGDQDSYKHLKKGNAACFYTPIVLKLVIVIQMWKQHE